NTLLALTGITSLEFEILSIAFEMAWGDYIRENYIDRKDRERQYGGGRKPTLNKIEDKLLLLLFILFSFKLYPLQTLIAFLFDINQRQADEQIHKLSAVLKMSLD
ncbi:hypothetical protein QUF90_19210, partial [Desulfococcaceae bacterium HSG9]|nr:hypothetical protein [Desulfococcaceae bacterium HSG9]